MESISRSISRDVSYGMGKTHDRSTNRRAEANDRSSEVRPVDRMNSHRSSEERIPNDISGASSMTSLKTGEINVDEMRWSRPRPAPRRKGLISHYCVPCSLPQLH